VYIKFISNFIKKIKWIIFGDPDTEYTDSFMEYNNAVMARHEKKE
jgi:hypothetical protein